MSSFLYPVTVITIIRLSSIFQHLFVPSPGRNHFPFQTVQYQICRSRARLPSDDARGMPIPSPLRKDKEDRDRSFSFINDGRNSTGITHPPSLRFLQFPVTPAAVRWLPYILDQMVRRHDHRLPLVKEYKKCRGRYGRCLRNDSLR